MKRRYLLAVCLGLFATFGLSMIQVQAEDADAFTITETGRIDDRTPFTEYLIEVPNDGSTIIADIRSADGDITFDTTLYLVDASGQIVAENGERAGGEPGDLTSRIEFPQALAGEYRVIATRYRVLEGTAEGDYVLTIEVKPPEIRRFDYRVDDEALAESGFPSVEPRPRATYTVLAYYGGDNNLEQALIRDVKQFEQAGGSDENVRVIVMLDRSPQHSTVSGDWSGARVFELGPDFADEDEPLEISTTELASLNEAVDSGDGELFAQFLTWGITTFPADNYILAMGSHGVAWRGIITSDSDESTVITLPELREALELVRQTTELERFDLLINDACYMASVEYHNVIADYFDYSLASPEVVLNPSHDMTLLTERLRVLAQTGVDPQPDEDVAVFSPILALSSDLADRYIDFDVQTSPGSDVVFTTSAVTDLREFGGLRDAIAEFALYVQEDPINRGALVWQARAGTYVYSGYKGGDELIDLGSLMSRLTDLLDPVENAEFLRRVQDVLLALDASVRYGRGGLVAERSVSTYHNIYFPSNSRRFDNAYFEDGFLGEWGAMLRALYNSVTPNPWDLDASAINFHTASSPDLNIVNVFPTGEISTLTSLNITAEIVGRNISSGDFVIDRIADDGTVQRIFTGRILAPERDAEGREIFVNRWEQGASTVPLTWDVQLPLLTDGDVSHFERINITEDAASLEGRYRQPDSNAWFNVTLIFDPISGEFVRAVAQSQETNSVAVIDIPEGSIFQSFRYRVTTDGRQVAELGNEYTFFAEEMRWRRVPAPSGEYAVGMTINTHGGTQTTSTLNLTVNNDDVEEGLVGFNQTGVGFIVARPSDWTVPDFVGNILRTESTDFVRNFSIYPLFTEVPEGNDPLQVTLDSVIVNFGLNLTGGPRQITLPDGTPSLEFDYTTRARGLSYIGRGFVTYLDTVFPAGLVMSAEVVGDQSRLDELYDILFNSFVRYDPADFRAVDTSQWTRFNTLTDVTHPIPISGWELRQPNEIDAWYRWESEELDGAFVGITSFIANPTRPRAEIRDTFFNREVAARRSDVTITADNLTYTGAYATWSALAYEATVNDTPVRGRFYLRLGNQRAYLVWFEVPATSEGDELLESVMEVVIDGLRIEDIPLERLGVLPGIVNLGPSTIEADDDTEPALLLRYDSRSLVLYNRLPNFNMDLSGLELRQLDEDGGLRYIVPIESFVVGDTSSVRPSDCYQMWTEDFFDVDAAEYPAEICRFRQGLLSTRNTFWTSERSGDTFVVLQNGELIATCLTVRPVPFEDYDVDNPNNVQRQCLVELRGQ